MSIYKGGKCQATHIAFLDAYVYILGVIFSDSVLIKTKMTIRFCYLEHCIAVSIGNVCFKTSKVGFIVVTEVKVFYTELGVFDFHPTISLRHDEEWVFPCNMGKSDKKTEPSDACSTEIVLKICQLVCTIFPHLGEVFPTSGPVPPHEC